MKAGAILQRLTIAAACACAAFSAWAQFKVVQPDGSVVYTDRPPSNGAARVTSVGPVRSVAVRAAPASPAETLAAGLPVELRAAVLRYPVTLYTTGECIACDSGRRLLQQRGIPYIERRVLNDDDLLALEKIVGVRSVPALAIGPQPLRGYVEADWHNFLDAAGYPRDSRLPKDWKAAEATPLAPRAPTGATAPSAPPAVAATAAPPAPARATLPEPPAPAPGSVRF